LLLHDCYDPPSAAAGFLDRQRAAGTALAIGVANAAVYDPERPQAHPADWTRQAAIDPAMLLGPALVAGTTILHSLARTDRWLRVRDPAYASAAELAVETVAALGERRALAFLLPYCLAATHVPQAKLIYATSQTSSLSPVLATVAAIDRAGGPAALAAEFGRAYAAALDNRAGNR
jgi:hypothetical protein